MNLLHGPKERPLRGRLQLRRNEPIWMKIWNKVSQMLGAGPGRFWGQFERP